MSSSNLEQSRKRLNYVWRKVNQDQDLTKEYENIIVNQLKEGIVGRAPEIPTGKRLFYMPHKPVVKRDARTTKVRMVFDASMKPHPMANSVNDCMFTGPPLQPLLWGILLRARVAPSIALADIQKAFLQVGVKDEDRDAFRFLFSIDRKEKQLRFTTIQHHLNQQPVE